MTASAIRTFRDRLESGSPAFGTFCALGSPAAVEFTAAEGFDFLILDRQHGLFGYADMVASLQALGRFPVTPLVRIPHGNPAEIERALDAGAFGVIVPGVESAEVAREVSSHCCYPPIGRRSFGPIRADVVIGSSTDVGNEALSFVMIETREGLEARDAICSTPGIDGIYIGPADVAVSLGLAPALDLHEPEHREAVDLILQTARAHGLHVGIHAGNGAQARQRADEGFSFITISTDCGLLRFAARRSLRDARAPRSDDVGTKLSSGARRGGPDGAR